MSRRLSVTTTLSRRRSRERRAALLYSYTSRSAVSSYAILMLLSRVPASIERALQLHLYCARIICEQLSNKPLPTQVGMRSATTLRQARPATGGPPGASAAVPNRPSPPTTL